MSNHAAEIGEQEPVTSPVSETEKRPWYRYYVLGLLTLVYASSYMDRKITAILMEDLKAEFALSDFHLGILSGLAFALFYATLGIPIARLADKYNRVNIISIAIAVWSGMTVFCGMAQSYLQLLLARVGVGVGEAGGNPPSHSIIADYFEPSKRPLALSIWGMGAVFGAVFGLAAGGWIAENYGWRWAFIVLGLPGILLAILVRLTIKEPVRGQTDTTKKEMLSDDVGLFGAIAELLSNRHYRLVLAGYVTAALFGHTIAIWGPTYFIRNWEMGQAEVGAIYGSLALFAGAGGALIGGFFTSHMMKKNPLWEVWTPTLACLLAIPAFVLCLMSSSVWGAFALFGTALFCYQFKDGACFSLIQSTVAANRRALGTSLVFFGSNIFGLGMAPLIVGYISDLQLGATPGQSLAVGLYIGAVGLSVATLIHWCLIRLVRNDAAQAS